MKDLLLYTVYKLEMQIYERCAGIENPSLLKGSNLQDNLDLVASPAVFISIISWKRKHLI